MGNNRFRLSDMIPNAWFHKLKRPTKNNHAANTNTNNNNNAEFTMEKPKLKQQTNQHFDSRKSYYFTRDLVSVDGFYASPDPPRKSTKKLHSSRKRILRSPPKLVTSSVSAGCSCRETIWSKVDSPPPDYSASSSSFSPSDGDTSSPTEFRSDFVNNVKKIDGLPELQLHPIVTKPAKFNDMVNDIKKKKERIKAKNNESKNTGPVRKFGVNSPGGGVKLRVNSPKIRSKRIQGHAARKSVSSTSSSTSSSLSESFAVVKSSFDPQKDFRESMVEMILENNITASKDLEDLLACYLSLNSDEYHQLIIKVFKQIWLDLNNVQFKS